MKKTLFIISLALSIFSTTAQNIRFYTTRDQLLGQNAEYVVSGEVGTEFIQAHLKVKNEGSNAISVKVQKQTIELHGESICAFCWVSCYPPFVNLSEFAMTIPGGSFAPSTLDADFSPDLNQPGTSRIAFKAFDVNNPNDSARVIVVFEMTVATIGGIDPAAIKLYPNPAINKFIISHAAGSKMVIFNALGKQVMQSDIISNNQEIHIESLPRGMYIIQLLDQSNKPVRSQKLLKN